MKIPFNISDYFKEQLIMGNTDALKGKALKLELINIRKNDFGIDQVNFKILITDEKDKTLIYLDIDEQLTLGDTVTITDLNSIFHITLV